MRKLLVLAFGCLLFSGVAAQADTLYNFNGLLATTSGNANITGQFTWDGSNITSWSLDFGALAGTCGYACQLGGLQPFSTIGDGFMMVGKSSDPNDSQPGDDSYMSYSGGLTNTILAIGGMQNDSATYSAQLAFDFNAIPGAFNIQSGNNAFAEFTLPNGNQNDYSWVSGSATSAVPEPPSVVLTLTGGLLLMAGLVWYERREVVQSC